MSIGAVDRVAEIQAMTSRLTGAGAAAAPAANFQQTLNAATGAGAPASAATAALNAPGAATGGTPINGVPYAAEINAAAAKHGVDPALLTALVKQESGFNPKAGSHAGAQGLCQLMPGTARSLGVTDPFDPIQNLDGGAKYLRRQLDAFNGNVEKALAAYNAGPGAVSRFGGIPPYPETQNYVKRVTAMAEEFRAKAASSGAPAAAAPAAAAPAVAASAALATPAPAAASPASAASPTPGAGAVKIT